MLRIGFGYDAHRFTDQRPLVLGGVEIPHAPGLEGHSDADVLTHAVMDALLGAVGAGDIGCHFPPGDPQTKGISSLRLLERVMELVHGKGYRLNNLDATLVAEQPRLAHHLEAMRERLAACLASPPERINLKATTTEGMGFCGRREGMAAYAVLTLFQSVG